MMNEPGMSTRRALVLAGGGVVGISWMLGLIHGLRRHELDLAAADLIVGTSAGACVGAAIATVALEQAVEGQRREDTSEIIVPFDGANYFALARSSITPADSARRPGGGSPTPPALGLIVATAWRCSLPPGCWSRSVLPSA